MSERDHRRQLAVGAGTSPADPDGHPMTSRVDGDVDVVQAVAALVSDLVEVVDDPAGATDDPGDAATIGDAAVVPDCAVVADGAVFPEAVGTRQQDLAHGPDGTPGDAVAPGPDAGGKADGPTAR